MQSETVVASVTATTYTLDAYRIDAADCSQRKLRLTLVIARGPMKHARNSTGHRVPHGCAFRLVRRDPVAEPASDIS